MTHPKAQLWDWSAWHCSVHHTTLPRSLAGGCGGGGARQPRRRGILCELLTCWVWGSPRSQGIFGAPQSFMRVGFHPRDSERENRAQKTFTIQSHFLQNVVTVRIKFHVPGGESIPSQAPIGHPPGFGWALLPSRKWWCQSKPPLLTSPQGPQTISDIIWNTEAISPPFSCWFTNCLCTNRCWGCNRD